jgi:arsenate reductase
MAEGLTNHLFGNEWSAFSAGTKPAGYVHPLARKVVAEIGIDHDGRSKSVDEFQDHDFDLVVTVCDQAQDDCPTWFGRGNIIHRSFPDPAEAVGSEEQILEAFQAVRDQLRADLPNILTISDHPGEEI